jgi:hypothetical protein
MSHDFIPGSGTKSPSNSNGQGNGHGLLTGELASVDPISSILPGTGERFDIACPSRNSGKGSSLGKSNNRRSGRGNDAQRSAPTAIEFSELKDGSLVDVVESPDNPKKTLFAVSKDGKTTYHSRLERGREVLVPLPRDGAIFQHVRLPRSTEPYGSVLELSLGLLKLITDCVHIKEEYEAPLLHFVVATWVADRLPIAPYLSIVGLPQSGKTTLLRVLGLICRRPLLTGDITSAAFYEVCTRVHPTLLIDESGTPGDNRALRHLLRMGTSPELLAMRKHQIFNAYGPKVICWKETPDDPALNSRCVEIQMVESDTTDLFRVDDFSVRARAAELQAKLLQFRFERYKKVRAPATPDAERLQPRSRDILASLMAPFAEHMELCTPLIQFFKMREIHNREPLPPPENAVLTALFSQIHQEAYTGSVLIQNLTIKVNEILEKSGERLRLSPRKVGSVLATFGVGWKRRTNTGWMILLDRPEQVRVHNLVRSHGLDLNVDRFIRTDWRECPLCMGESHRPEPQSDPK